MDAVEREILYYQATDGSIPFREWRLGLKDAETRTLVDLRIARVRAGNLGYYRHLGEGLLELKMDHGPGFRVYLGQRGRQVVLLLTGGTKSTQDADIRKARAYWLDYCTRT